MLSFGNSWPSNLLPPVEIVVTGQADSAVTPTVIVAVSLIVRVLLLC